MSLSIKEKYDLVRTLIILGKKRGYLLYDEVNNILPAEVRSLEEIEDLLSTFEQYGIDIYEDVSAAKAAHAEPEVAEPIEAEAKEEVAASGEEVELDLTPDLLEKTNDPIRLYLREMRSVPLLRRESEVAIAKRIERGQLRVLKTISRSPMVLKELLATGEELRKGTRSINDIIHFNEEELTEDKIENKTRHTLRIIHKIEKLYDVALKQAARLEHIPRSNKRVYLRARYQLARTRIAMSLLVRSIDFNRREKKRLLDTMRHTIERVHSLEREAGRLARCANATRQYSR